MNYLTERELRVLRMRVDRKTRKTYQQIGDELGVSPLRAKQIHDQAVRKVVLRELERNA